MLLTCNLPENYYKNAFKGLTDKDLMTPRRILKAIIGNLENMPA
jgi:hypothetical protein